MELVKINASEYGLEESKAQEIEAQFKPMLAKMSELEKEYNKIIKLEINGETCAKAKELRLRYVKVRTGTADIHKAQKAFYLAGGRFVDGWKNAQLFASQSCEDALMAIEKHYENIEKERTEKLQQERQAEVCKYEGEMIVPTLGIMDDDVWNNYINGVKLNHQHKIAAEKKVEEERIEAEEKLELSRLRKYQLMPLWDFVSKKDQELDYGSLPEKDFGKLFRQAESDKQAYINEQEKIRKENERLEKEAVEKSRIEEELKVIREKRNNELKPYIIFIREYDTLLNKGEKEYQKEFSEIKIGAKQHWEHEKQERIKQNEKEEKERLEREKLKAKIEAKEEAERKEKQRLLDEEQKRLKAEKIAALAPDKDKLIELSNRIMSIDMPELKAKEANDIMLNVVDLLSKIDSYIKEKVENL